MATKTAQKPATDDTPIDAGGTPLSGDMDTFLDDALAFASGEAPAAEGEGEPPAGEEKPAGGGEAAADDKATDTDDKSAGEEKPAGGEAATDDKATDDAVATDDKPTGEEKPAGDEKSKQEFDPESVGKAIVDAIGKATSAPKGDAAPEEDLDEDVPVTIDDFLDDADREKLKAFDSEWSDVSQAVNARLNQHINYTEHKVLTQVANALAPVVSALKQLQVTQQRAEVQSAFPEYKQMLPEVKAWIGKQPTVIRSTLEGVLQRGSSKEIIEVFSAYKEATKGGQQPAPSTPGSQVTDPAPAPKAKPTPSKEALAATTGVQSERKPNVAVDKDDYDAALGEALTNL